MIKTKLLICSLGIALLAIGAVKAQSPSSSVTAQFGGCDGQIHNCLPIIPGWNYMVRLYRPRAEILDGKWKFPEALDVY